MGSATLQVEDLLNRHKLQTIFRLWDKDKDGAVEQDVVEHALKRFVHTRLSHPLSLLALSCVLSGISARSFQGQPLNFPSREKSRKRRSCLEWHLTAPSTQNSRIKWHAATS